MARVTATLEVRGVAITRGNRRIVNDVSFSATRGELLAVMGASGTGKTTVLRAMGGLDPIAAGAIDIDGVRLAAGPIPRGALRRELHRRVGMVFQFHHLFAHMSALHNVWLAPVHVLGQPRADAERRARELLEMLGVGGRADSMPQELSGGEAQRVAIARALAVEPPVLLMDEPTASLDQARRGELAATLRQLAAQGRTVIVATHDTDFARACAHRVVMLDEGRVVEEGTPELVLAPHRIDGSGARVRSN
jgi:ABC-type polar amino acid transport system ATPase subunit